MKDILVVDDDASGRAMLSLSLRKAGFNVRTAAGGPEALDLLRGNHFDWMITDARMDPMDGFQLSRQAKQLQPTLRIVMISAVYSGPDGPGSPIEKFYPKPVAVEELVRSISA